MQRCERAKSCKHLGKGQNHPKAKLTDREVELLRQMAEDGVPQSELVAKFEVSKSLVSMIVRYLRR